MEPNPVIAQARAVYEQLQDQELARSPLAGMAEWVSSGAAPASAELRALGLTFAGLDEATTASLRLARKAFTRHWGFAIPCAEAVEAVCRLSPLVEIGAGTGYWSAMLAAAGADVVATDIHNADINPHGFRSARHFDVRAHSATEAVSTFADRDVLCVWPTEGEPWAAEAISGMAPGRRLALVGTPRGGITGDVALFDLLDAAFRLEATIEIPQFPQVNDELRVYTRISAAEAEGL